MRRGFLAALLLGFSAPALAEEAHGPLVDAMDCSACHTAAGWDLSPEADGARFEHAQTGFPLRGAHRSVACTGCHRSGRPTPRTCSGCHEDAHAARLGEACADCHSPGDWRDAQTLERHRRTRLPLTGRHAIIDCTACHRRTTDRAFTHVPADCFACHEQEYRGTTHPAHVGDPANSAVRPFPRDCGACHRTTTWSEAVTNPSIFEAAVPAGHDLRFVVSFGKHRGAACDSCHTALPRRPREVRCSGCHDPQRAHRRRQAMVTVSAAGCLRCHPRGMAR